jgi:hypothetical protein
MPLYVDGTEKQQTSLIAGITTHDVALMCDAIYARPGAPPEAWDHLDDGTDSDGVCWGLRRMDMADFIIFRGSVTFEDWFRDAANLAVPWRDSQLGPVHPGFLLGMRQVWNEVVQLISA